VLQATDNLLINASNVDPFLNSRAANHLWSHEIKMSNPESRSCYGSRGVQLLQETLGRPYGAFVAWTKGGHELRQENKRVVVDLLDALAISFADYEDNTNADAHVSTSHMKQGYEGAQSHEKGSLVPTQDFIKAVNKKEEIIESLREKEEKKMREKEEKEQSMSVEMILDEGKMSQKEQIEKLERERIEEEERLLAFDDLVKEEELKQKIENETSKLFGNIGGGEKFKEVQNDIEEKMNETINEIMEAPKNVLSGDEFLAKLQQESDEIEAGAAVESAGGESQSEMSAVRLMAHETSERSKALRREEVKRTKDRVAASVFVEPNKEKGLTAGDFLKKEDKKMAETTKFDRVPSVPGGKPRFPDKITSNTEEGHAALGLEFDSLAPALDATVNEEFTEFKNEEKKRLEGEDAFNKKLATHSKNKVAAATKLLEEIDLSIANEVVVAEEKKEEEEDDNAKANAYAPPQKITIPKLANVEDPNETEGMTNFNELFSAPENPVAPAPTPDVKLRPGLFDSPTNHATITDQNRVHRSFMEDKDDQPRTADEVFLEQNEKESKFSRYKQTLENKRKEADKAAADMIEEIKQEQERRRKQYEAEDAALLNQLEAEKDDARLLRTNEDLQRRLELQKDEEKLMKKGLIHEYSAETSTASIGADGVTKPTDDYVVNRVMEMPPTLLEEQPDLPESMRVNVQKTDEVLAKLDEDQKKAEAMGIMRVEDFHQVQRDMAAQQLERDLNLRTMDQNEQQMLFNEMAAKIQVNYRGRLARVKSKQIRARMKLVVEEGKAALKIQKTMRGYLCMKKIKFVREMEISQVS